MRELLFRKRAFNKGQEKTKGLGNVGQTFKLESKQLY